MYTDTGHFSRCSSHQVHLDIHWDNRLRSIDDVYPSMQQIIAENKFHFVHLQGQELTSAQQMRRAIAEAYQFPTFEEDFLDEHYYDVINWDGISEWLGDLSWLRRSSNISEDVAGFLLLYSDPEHFFVRDPVEFAQCLDVISRETAYQQTKNVPFHVVISPVSSHVNHFIKVLRMYSYVCLECLNQATDKYIYLWE